MAEALAVIGLVSAIVQFVEFGTKIVSRLHEFESDVSGVPETFRSLSIRLPLLVDSLQKIHAQAEAHLVGENSAKALKPVVEDSLVHIKTLIDIIEKDIPAGDITNLQRRLKALKSLTHDKKVQKTVSQLEGHFNALNLHINTIQIDQGGKLHEQFTAFSISQADQSTKILTGITALSTEQANRKGINFDFGLLLGQAPQISEDAFIGRTSELDLMKEWLSPRPEAQNMVAVWAAGGMGKTQIAIRYATVNQGLYSSIFWINASDESTIRSAYISLAGHVLEEQSIGNIAGAADENLVIVKLRKWLSTPGNTRWLLVLDNYDDPNLPGAESATGYDIRQYFPFSAQGSILITSRSPRLEFARQFELRKLEDLTQSLQILSQRSGRSAEGDEDAKKLATRLNGLPLALATAGQYLKQTLLSFGEYFEAYEHGWDDLNKSSRRLFEYGDKTLFTAWDLSFARIQSQDPDAAEFMRLAAYFDNKDIWFELLAAGKKNAPPWFQRLVQSKMHFCTTLARLQDYSLVEVRPGGYSLHTCIHDWTLGTLNQECNEELYWLAALCISEAKLDYGQPDFWKKTTRLLPHAARLHYGRLSEQLNEKQLHHDRRLYLYGLSELYHCLGDFKNAEIFSRANLENGEQESDLGQNITLNALVLLGVCATAQSHYPEAERLYEEAVAKSVDLLGPQHRTTLLAQSELAKLYISQDRLAEAEEMLERVTSVMHHELEENDWLISETLSAVGRLYVHQERLSEAEDAYNAALANREKYYGPTHPGTLHLSTLLAYLSTGKDSYDTTTAQTALADIYVEQSRFKEAEDLYKRAVVTNINAVGPDSEPTIIITNALGALYELQGKLELAEEAFQRAYDGYLTLHGPLHSLTKKCATMLDRVRTARAVASKPISSEPVAPQITRSTTRPVAKSIAEPHSHI